MKTAAAADRPAMRIELTYQYRNAVRWNRSAKLPSPAPVGTRLVEESEPTGFTAAETTNTTGNSENSTASRPTTWRHPTLRNHLVTSTPPRGGGCAGS